MKRIMMRLFFLIGIVFFCSCSASKYIETSLYFGQSKPDGGMIAESEWNSFKEKHISTTFKEGSSVVSLTGNWYDTASHKLITEPTYQVSYYHKKNRLLSRQIDSIRNLYKQLFYQQSVLRVDKKVNAEF